MAQAERVVRVFVSSTFRDMHAERDHLVTVVFPELRERVEQLGLQFYDVDLRWGVPKTGIDGELANSWEYCKQWIYRVEPFFLCLLGQRYGWVPPPAQIKNPEDRAVYQGLSITEMEIRLAALSTELKRRSYFYFRRPLVPKNVPSEIYSEYVDPDYEEQLRELKGKILQSKRPVRDYDCDWTGTSFANLEEFGRLVLEDLWSGILRDPRYVPEPIWQNVTVTIPAAAELLQDENRNIPAEVAKRITTLARPAQEDPFEAEKAGMAFFAASRLLWFRGREVELQKLQQFLNMNPGGGLCLVAGPAGQGKSAFLARFVNDLTATGDHVFSHFVGATERSAEISWLLQRLETDLQARQIHSGNAEEIQEEVNLRTRLRLRLENYAGPQRVVIVIDAVNQLNDGLDLEWLPQKLGKNVRIVLSTISSLEEGSPEKRIVQACYNRSIPPHLLELPHLNKEEIRKIISDYLREYCKELDAEDIEKIVSLRQAGNPLYLLVLLNEMRTLGGNDMHKYVSELISTLQNRFPDTVELFEWMLERAEVFGKEAVRLWFQYLYISRGGMASRELRDLLALRCATEGPAAAMRIERSLRRYLLYRGGLLDFFHGQFGEAVRKRYGSLQNNTALHADVALYFSERWKKEDHAASEAPYHLYHGELTGELYNLLDDPDFRARKLALHGSAQDVCQDIQLALDAALKRNDYANIGHFGFLHADYAQGRFEVADLLQLHLKDPSRAYKEVRLNPERPRFRLLLLLALKEAQIGQTDAADKLIHEAGRLKGIKLPETDLPFLQHAVQHLLRSGCHEPHTLLLVPFGKLQAATALAAICQSDVPQREELLGVAVELIQSQAKILGSGQEFLQTWQQLCKSIQRLPNPQVIEELLRDLEKTVDKIESTAGAALKGEDVLTYLMLAFVGDKPGELGIGIKHAARACLASAFISAGMTTNGWKLMETAVEGAGEKTVEAVHFTYITSALLNISESISYFRRLLGKARGEQQIPRLEKILEAIVESENPGLILPYLEEAEKVVVRIEPMKRAGLGDLLIRAHRRAKNYEGLRRLHAADLSTPRSLFYFLYWNPFIPPDRKFNLLKREIQLASGTGNDHKSWTKISFLRAAKLLAELETNKLRRQKWLELLLLAFDESAPDLVSIVRKSSAVMNDEEERVKALQEAISVSDQIADPHRTAFRDEILKLTGAFRSEKFRWATLQALLLTAGTDEKQLAQEILQRKTGALPPGLQAEIHGTFAGHTIRNNQMDSALRWWQECAREDRRAAAETNVLVSRITAATLLEDSAAWDEVLKAARCPDPETASIAIAVAAGCCGDLQKLRQLEVAIEQIQRGYISSNYKDRAADAILSAYIRLGQSDPGVRYATKSHLLFDHPDVVSNALRNGNPKILRSISDASLLLYAARILYLRFIENPVSKITDEMTQKSALAEILAERGQEDIAFHLAFSLDREFPKEDSFEDTLLYPVAKAEALLQRGKAYAAIYQRRWKQEEKNLGITSLLKALQEASAVKGAMFLGRAVRAAAEVWKELVLFGAPEAETARNRAEEMAKNLATSSAEGMGDRWGGYLSLISTAVDLKLFTSRVQQYISSIDDETKREEARIDVIQRLPLENWPELLHCWERLPSANGRKQASEILRQKMATPEPPQSSVRSSASMNWPEFGAYNHFLLKKVPISFFCFLLPAFLTLFFLLISTRLNNISVWIWLPFLAVLTCASMAIVHLMFRGAIKSRAKRIFLTLAAIPLQMFVFGILGWLWFSKKIPQIRIWWFTRKYRRQWRDQRKPLPRKPPGNQEGLKPLLRSSVSEAATFDSMFATFLSDTESLSSKILERLPGFRIPNQAPADLLNQQFLFEEAGKELRLFKRLMKRTRKAIRQGGFLLTKKLLYPAIWIAAWHVARKRKRAHEIVMQAQKLFQAHKDKEAVPLYKKAADLAPHIPEYWNDYGVALCRSGNVDLGIRAIQTALEKGAGSEREFEYWYSLAYNLWMAGRTAEAIQPFEQVIQLAPHGDELYQNAIAGKGFCETNLRRGR